jgi:cytochrome c oxidase subunit 4
LDDRSTIEYFSLTYLLSAYYIAFGAHGPRAQSPKGEGWRIFGKVVQLTAASVAIFYAVHAFAGKQPATMSKEWQEASNEYALVISPLSNPPFRPSRDISWKF